MPGLPLLDVPDFDRAFGWLLVPDLLLPPARVEVLAFDEELLRVDVVVFVPLLRVLVLVVVGEYVDPVDCPLVAVRDRVEVVDLVPYEEVDRCFLVV